MAQHLDREETEAPYIVPEIPHNAFERPWIVCPETRHLRPVVEWLRSLPRECPIVLRIPEGPRLRRVVREERILQQLGERIRDVRQGPDGYVYLLTDSDKGRILRLEPAGP